MIRFSQCFVAIAFVAVVGVSHAQGIDILATVTDEHGKPLSDAVVVAVAGEGSVRPPIKPRDDLVDQVDKQFVPKVMAVLAGTPVSFPNHDNVRHQVYSFSAAKRFELPLYAGVPAQPIVFDKPGVVVLGCNIHDWMVGYIYVSESPYFAKTGADGKATLADLPPRAYVVRVWHPQADAAEETTRKTVDASRGRVVAVDWALKLRPEVRARRAPIPDRGARY